MSPYELAYAGGASEHHNEEPGAKWLARVRETWRKAVWLNPQPQDWWDAHQSIQIVQRLFEGRMYPLTLVRSGRGDPRVALSACALTRR